LCIEEQFYLFLPLILMLLVSFNLIKKGFWILIVLFLFGFFIRYHTYQSLFTTVTDESWLNWYKWVYYPTWTRLDGLLVGVSIAGLLEFKPAFSRKILNYGNLAFVIGLIIFATTYFVCADEESLIATVFGFPLVAIGYGFIVLSALSPKCFLYKYESKITTKIATLSYGIYLIHKIVIHVTQNQLAKLNITDKSNITFLICIVTVFIASLVLNETIEKPFLKLRKKILKKERAGLKELAEAA